MNTAEELIQFDNIKLITQDDINPLNDTINNLSNISNAISYNGSLEDKENIQQFIDVQKQIKSFRAKVKKTAKEFKKPYQDINKQIIALEKTLLANATEIFDSNEEKFSEYRKHQQEKNSERQAKKDALFNEKIEQANKTAIEANYKHKRSELFGSIKESIYNLELTSIDNATTRNLFYLTNYEENLRDLTINEYVWKEEDIELLGTELFKEYLNYLISIIKSHCLLFK